MVETKRLLEDLKRLLKRLENDLRERMAAVPEMRDRLRAEYHAARDAGRTGAAFEAWREEVLTQAAAAWVLGSVFVRFMEDNALADAPLISGPGERRGRAADRQTLYFQSHPTDTDRDYLYDVFRTVGRLPAVAKLFDEVHNPLWARGISGDAAKELIGFWRQVVPETGELVHSFTDPEWDTRFLGGLRNGSWCSGRWMRCTGWTSIRMPWRSRVSGCSWRRSRRAAFIGSRRRRVTAST